MEGNGELYYELVKQQKLEEIILKRADSFYHVNKRSNDWLKIINSQFEDVYVSGIRKEKFGLFLNFENGNHAGIMDFMSPQARKDFYKRHKNSILEETDTFIHL